jgi:hypothetical protein
MMDNRHKKIKELNLEDAIRTSFFKHNKSISLIADELGIPFSAVQRFVREEKMKNFSDNRLEAIAKGNEDGAFLIINDIFDSASYARKEMAMTAILAQMFREDMAEVIAKGGVRGLLEEENRDMMREMYKNAEKLSKLQANVPKYLDAYINLLTQVLDLQRQVSFVKVVTEELRKADPVLHKKIFDALNADTAAKAVMGSISTDEIVEYWTSDRSIAGRANLSKRIEEEEE